MLAAVKVPSRIQSYIESLYSQLFVTVASKNWNTPLIPFHWSVFQGDTTSPIIFLLAFNSLLKLAADLNQGHSYTFKLPLPNSEDFPPLDSTIYVKWVEEGDEPLGWHRARVSEYFQDGSCKVIYDDSLEIIVSVTISLHTVEWLPCSRRAKRFVPINATPVTTKPKRNPSPKF